MKNTNGGGNEKIEVKKVVRLILPGVFVRRNVDGIGGEVLSGEQKAFFINGHRLTPLLI